MGNKYFNSQLKKFMADNWREFDKDLFSAFTMRCFNFTNESG